MYAPLDRLHNAALVVAGAGTPKRRLIDAWLRHLQTIDEAWFPEPLRSEFRALFVAMSQVAPMRGENTALASVRKMANDEAAAHLQSIVRLYGAMARHTALVSTMRDHPLAPVVPISVAQDEPADDVAESAAQSSSSLNSMVS